MSTNNSEAHNQNWAAFLAECTAAEHFLALSPVTYCRLINEAGKRARGALLAIEREAGRPLSYCGHPNCTDHR